MNFYEFQKMTEKDMKEFFHENGMPIKVKIDTVKKVGMSYTGMELDYGKNIHPVFNLEQCYEDLEMMPYKEVFRRMAESAMQAIHDAPEYVDFDLQNASERLFVQLVSTERNREVLDQIPHREVEDLSLICRIEMPAMDGHEANAVVKAPMLQMMGMTQEELFEAAMKNSVHKRPEKLETLQAVLARMVGHEVHEEGANEFYVLTNKQANLGAATIFYPEVMEKCAEELNGNFYIIPSSLHEVLLCPENPFIKSEKMKSVVKEINDTQLLPEEILSYQVYHYDYKEKVFELGEVYEARVNERNKYSLRENLEEMKNRTQGKVYPKRENHGEKGVRGESSCL